MSYPWAHYSCDGFRPLTATTSSTYTLFFCLKAFASSRGAMGAAHLLGWISFLGLPKESTTNWVVYNNNKFFSHRSGGNKVQSEGVSRAMFWKALRRILSCLLLASWPFLVCGSTTPVSASLTNKHFVREDPLWGKAGAERGGIHVQRWT